MDNSPWPLLRSLGALSLTIGIVVLFHISRSTLLLESIFLLILIRAQWWRDVRREGRLQGLHTMIVQRGLRWGVVLFIVSEIILFFSFFWAFFHRSLSPRIEIGCQWPPVGITAINPFNVPLLNTLILLSSGATVTWSHHSLMEDNHDECYNGLYITVLLGIFFTLVQLLEYIESSFRVSDSVYGSRFFIMTGFHGLHVLVGTCFLIVTLYRLYIGELRITHHLGFEAAAWYWHFVDVVWLFLYICVYWWGGA